LLRNSQVLPDRHISKLVPYKSDNVFLVGIIVNDPIYQDKQVSFILNAEKLEINVDWYKTCGKVLVKVFSAECPSLPDGIKNKFSYGDRLFLKAKLSRPFSFSKGFNYRII